MHPVVRECIRNFASNFPLEIHHDADLPAQSGIGSSSAFTVALIHALHSLQGLDINCNELAAKAIQIEYRILKENVGWQDQISCAIGGLNYIKFGPDESWQVHPINQDTSYINMLFSRLALVYTGTQRYSSNISENLIEGIRNKNNQISKLMLLADQCRAIFETQGDLDQIGSMLDYSWQIKKSLNSNATNHEINELYKLGIKSGASGGKLIGAGGGGFLLFYLPKDDVQSFQEKMQNFTVIPINISNTGSKLIHLA
jgi:D-glycero-alpha-D-manno-heptose-7-phosphate kinase